MMTKKVITQAVTLLSIVFFSAMAIPIPTGKQLSRTAISLYLVTMVAKAV